METGYSRPWPAPAKLNLMLRIVGRRADGYHLLQTVFIFLDRCDRLRFRRRADGAVRRSTGLPGVLEEEDLVVRAARLLQKHCAVAEGVEIAVEKCLPMGGGLGGGSSDAATVLVALNHYWKLGLDREGLARLGGRLGADVPVFVRGRAAWAEGVGDELTPLTLPEAWYLVVTPPCRVSTAAVFADPDLTRNSPRITIRDFLAGARGNDCAPVVTRRHPQLQAAWAWLARFGEPALTGTGACLFLEFEAETAARDVLARMPADLDGFVARGLNRSPLRDRPGLRTTGAVDDGY